MKRRVGVMAAAVLCVVGCKKGEEASQSTGAASGSATSGASNSGASGSAAASAKDADSKPVEGCNSDFKQPITADTTLTAACSPYTVSNELSIDGWDLTVEPGVEVRMGDRARIYVGVSKAGRITVQGTQEQPVRFVSARRKEPGAWRGFELGNESDGSRFEHVVIEHAGDDDSGIIMARNTGAELRNVQFVSGKGLAITQYDQGKKLQLTDSDLSGVETEGAVARLTAASVGAIKNVKFPEKAFLEITGGVHSDLQINDPGVPLRLTNAFEIDGKASGQSATLTVGPGVTFQVTDGHAIYVASSYGGSLKVQGTAEKPVTFTSANTESAKGSWRGFVVGINARSTRFEHALIENAGAADGQALDFRTHAPSVFKNVTVRGSKGNGLHLRDEADRWETFANNAFEDIDGAVLVAPAEMAHQLGAGNTFPTDNRIEVQGTVGRDTVWTAQTIPYVVTHSLELNSASDAKPATLTIEPGAVVKFADGVGVYVGGGKASALSAVGTTEKPITFTALNDDWRGIRATSSGKLNVQNAVVEKVAGDHYALTLDNGAGGTIKQVKFTDSPKVMRKCSEKVTAEALEAGTGEVVNDC